MAERLCGVAQRPVPRRIPQHRALLDTNRGPVAVRPMAAGVQHPQATFGPLGAYALEAAQQGAAA
jgi:hypothetical protein